MGWGRRGTRLTLSCCLVLSRCAMRTESLTHATEDFRPCKHHFSLPFESHRPCQGTLWLARIWLQAVGSCGSASSAWAGRFCWEMSSMGCTWPYRHGHMGTMANPNELPHWAGRGGEGRREQSLGSTSHRLPAALPHLFCWHKQWNSHRVQIHRCKVE